MHEHVAAISDVALRGPDASGCLSVSERGADLLFLTWMPAPMAPVDLDAARAYVAIDAALRERAAVPLLERVFVTLAAMPCVRRGRMRAVGGREEWDVPPTVVQGTPIHGGSGFAGIHVLAVRGARGAVRALCHRGQVRGRVVEARNARFVGLSDTGQCAARRARGPADDTTAAIATAETLLDAEGMSFGDVARTWFYLRDILDWYDDFNAARNDAFRRMRLAGHGILPASTAIGGQAPGDGWCALDLLAARPNDGGELEMRRLHNRRQNEATEYGSAFARGVSLTVGGFRYLFVSGTASIDERGATIHAGDFAAQLRRTVENVAALLESEGASLSDLRQVTAFVKKTSDVPAYERMAIDTGLADVPSIATLADVCRDDLLFELDATAIVPDPRGHPR